MKRAWGVVGVGGLVGFLAVSASVRADDESDRRRYREEIDRLLEGVRSDLDRVAGDSGTGYVDAAISKADEVRSKAQSLYGIKAGDRDAERIGSSYPRIAERFRDAARSLRELKTGQRSLDELPRRPPAETSPRPRIRSRPGRWISARPHRLRARLSMSAAQSTSRM